MLRSVVCVCVLPRQSINRQSIVNLIYCFAVCASSLPPSYFKTFSCLRVFFVVVIKVVRLLCCVCLCFCVFVFLEPHLDIVSVLVKSEATRFFFSLVKIKTPFDNQISIEVNNTRKV